MNVCVLWWLSSIEQTEQSTFGRITNGVEFLSLKAMQQEYGNSRLFSLVNPGNKLWDVLRILKGLGEWVAIAKT